MAERIFDARAFAAFWNNRKHSTFGRRQIGATRKLPLHSPIDGLKRGRDATRWCGRFFEWKKFYARIVIEKQTWPRFIKIGLGLRMLRARQLRSSRTIHRSTRSKITPVAAAPQPQERPARTTNSNLESQPVEAAKSHAAIEGWVTSKNPALTMPSKDPPIKSKSTCSPKGRPFELRMPLGGIEVRILLLTSAVEVITGLVTESSTHSHWV
jgi:hypothetical protein